MDTRQWMSSVMEDLGRLNLGLRATSNRDSWFDDPKLLRAHHVKRRRHRQRNARMRKTRRARSQNMRTGAR